MNIHSHSNTQRYNLVFCTRKHTLDDVQELLILKVEQYFNQLEPNNAEASRALVSLFDSIVTLIDWTSRTPRGRAQMRKRILNKIDSAERWTNDNKAWLADYHEHVKAAQLVESILEQLNAEDDTTFEQTAATEYGDALDAWLAAGGDSAEDDE